MVVAHIGANGLSLETDRWGRARGESRGFRQQPMGTDHLVAYHLAPAITDFISDENRVCYNNDLEQTLTLLHSEWSKEIEPSGQSSTHHPLVVSNKGSEFMRRGMRWEAPSMPTSAYDPGLLCEQETPLVIGKNWFLDQEIPAGGFVRIQDLSQVWEERVDETRIITTEGLNTCLDQRRGWTQDDPGPRTTQDRIENH